MTGRARLRLKSGSTDVSDPVRPLAPLGHPWHMYGMTIRIGTSGWYYRHWLGPYYPVQLRPSAMLRFYAAHFDTVELNNSFYHLPSASAVAGWRDETPDGFLFAVKASRYLTHIKRLKESDEGLRRFLSVMAPLGEKLGPILFQLPPRWACDRERLAGFLEALPRDHRCVFEFRDQSWHVPLVFQLLERHGMAYCLYDRADFRTTPVITADFTYIRFHGPGSRHDGDYPRETLETWANWITGWAGHISDVYVYFNNDVGGHAVKNARELACLLGLAVPTMEPLGTNSDRSQQPLFGMRPAGAPRRT